MSKQKILEPKEVKVRRIVYRDIDFVKAPQGWIEAKLQNRFSEGFAIFRDFDSLSWVCEKVIK